MCGRETNEFRGLHKGKRILYSELERGCDPRERERQVVVNRGLHCKGTKELNSPAGEGHYIGPEKINDFRKRDIEGRR